MTRGWKRHRLTLALVATAVALSAVAIWDRRRITTDESDARKAQLFDAWRGDDVTGVTSESGTTRIELTLESDDRGERTWVLREGERTTAADEQEVDSFLATLEYAGFERRVEGLDRSVLGLDPPSGVVSIAMGTLRYTLRLGAEAPSPPGARYAEVEGGARPTTAYVIPRELAEALRDKPGRLRSRQLVPYVSSDVERYEFVDGATRWTLRRAGSGGRATVDMRIESDATGDQRAAWRAVDAWTIALARLDALRFIDDPGAASDAARLTLVPRNASKARVVLEIGGACEGGVLVRRVEPERIAACADARALESIRASAARFVDDRVLGVPETDVTELRLRDATTTVELARRGEGWHLRAPDDAQIDAAVGNALLQRIAGAAGERLSPEASRDDARLGLAPPRATVRVVGLPERAGGEDGSEHVEEIDVGGADGGVVHVRRRSDGAVLRVPVAAAAALLPAPSALRSSQVLDVPVKHVRGLELECGGKAQRLARDARGNWTRLAPATPLEADAIACNELTEDLRVLAAIRWDAERSEPRHGLERSSCLVGLVVAEPDASGATSPDDPNEPRRTIRIAVGAETDGGFFARREGSGAVFVAPRSLVSHASEWLLNRAGLLVDPATVERVSLTVGRRALSVIRRGDAWAISAGTAPNDARAATVMRALEGMLADGVATLGPAPASEGFENPRARVVLEVRNAAPVEWLVGAAGLRAGTKVGFVRRQGLDATFAVDALRLQPLLDAP